MSAANVLIGLISVAGLVGQTTPARQEHVPAVTAGPDLESEAAAVEAKIAEVTVFSDRARVRRKAEVTLAAGINTLRLPDLPGAALLDTVRMAVPEAKLLRVEAAPIEREKLSIAAVEAALAELEKRIDQHLAVQAKLRVQHEELNFLADLGPKAPADEQFRQGRPLPALALDGQRIALDFLGERRRAARARARQLEEEDRVIIEAIDQLRRTVALRDLGAFTARTIRVLAIVEAKAAVRAKVTLEYFVPGASWLPAYELHYFAKDSKLEMSTYGLVTQATGEDWSDVELNLSTAIPGQGIELPELLTWTLGEKGELIPRPQPARYDAPRPFAGPTPKETEKEQARAIAIGQLAERYAALEAMMSGMPAPAKPMPSTPSGRVSRVGKDRAKKTIDFEDDTITGDLVKPDSSYVASRERPAAKQMPAETEMQMAPASVAVSMSGSAHGGSRSSGESVARTSLALFDTGGGGRPTFSDPHLPAMLAGGLDYVYPAASRFTVPSTANKLRVPLSVERYPASVYYEATPSLSTNAFLKATVENKAERPLLAGPVGIFAGNDFAGDGELRTTGPGGKIELPLGADEDIRMVRKVVPATRTEGVFKKDDLTSYRTEIEVGNYKRRPVRVLVLDQVPKTNEEDVKITLDATSPKPIDPPNAEGLMRFELQIPAGETRKISFSYTVKRPSGWRLQQY